MSDITIQPVTSVLTTPGTTKPTYAIVLDKGKVCSFITVDRPDLQASYVQAKGFFVNQSEDDVVKNFNALLTKCSKEDIVEVIFPWSKISHIRNLLFKSK